MISRTLTRRLKYLETRSVLTAEEHVYIIRFLAAGDQAAKLTLQLGPGDTSMWTDLSDPSNPRTWTGLSGRNALSTI
jgi:hypothetical protein